MSENDGKREEPDFSFGEELRKQREIRRIGLPEIADATKISKRFLEALERDDFASLPAPVFTRGFVREYARYLGLNAEEMVDRYAQYARLVEKPEDPQPQPLVSATHVPERQARTFPWRAAIIGLLLLIAVAVLVAWFFYPQMFGSTDEAAVAPVPVAVATPSAPHSTPSPLPASESLTLLLETTASVWAVVEADGRRVLHEELPPRSNRSITASERIIIRELGNAGGVSVTLNGRRLGPLGAEGEVVRDHSFDRTTLAGAAPTVSPE